VRAGDPGRRAQHAPPRAAVQLLQTADPAGPALRYVRASTRRPGGRPTARGPVHSTCSGGGGVSCHPERFRTSSRAWCEHQAPVQVLYSLTLGRRARHADSKPWQLPFCRSNWPPSDTTQRLFQHGGINPITARALAECDGALHNHSLRTILTWRLCRTVAPC